MANEPAYKMKNNAEQKVIVTALKTMGFKILSADMEIAKYLKDNPATDNHYIWVQLTDSGWIINGCNFMGSRKEVSLGEFLANAAESILKNRVIEVKLNSNYKAEVTKDSVVVGCQTFTHKAIKELYNATLEVQK
jgi:hypothetical protein